MKFIKPSKSVLNAADKFGASRDDVPIKDLVLLGEYMRVALNDEDLKVGEVHSFFWSMVETYVDRFQQYPFDINKALISYLELQEYPEEMVRQLVDQLEAQFEVIHGRPLREPTTQKSKSDALDEEINQLRGSLKYAAMVAEGNDT